MKRRPRRGFGEDGFESRGGYMPAKKEKLKEQFALTAAKEVAGDPNECNRGIFNGIAIYVNGFTSPCADELKRIMMVHGGMYHHYLSGNTTHIVATNLPNVKIMKLKVMKVVKPEWIVESVKADKLLDFRSYLLYSHQSVTQPRLQFETANKTASENLSPTADIGSSQEPSGQKESQGSMRIEETLVNTKQRVCAISLGKDINDQESSNNSAQSSPCAKNSELNNESEANSTSSATSNIVEAASEKVVPKTSSWTSRSAGDAGFLSEFYNNSRLHHLSTMGAAFKQYVNELREKSDQVFPGRDTLKKWMMENNNVVREEIVEKDINDDENMFEGSGTANAMEKVVMHIDMDCFFVSVGLRDRPDLRGRPVAVTHAKGGQPGPRPGVDRRAEFDMYKQRIAARNKQLPTSAASEDVGPTRVDNIDETMSMSEIASCSYEARAAGVKNGMFMGSALKLCPGLQTIPYDFEAYKQVSYALYNTIARYTLDIEAVSCDELFVDCTKLLKETGAKPLDFASCIRNEIKGKTGCAASAGLGSNVLQARLATRKAKPDGQFLLTPDRVQHFMGSVSVGDLPGIGRSMSWKLRGLSVETCSDLQQLSLGRLQKEFGGKTGQSLFRHCRGRDDRSLCAEHVRKSVSAEVNYGIRFSAQPEAEVFLRQLAAEVAARLGEIAMRGRCITLKLMVRAKDAPVETAKFMGHGVCDHITKSASLPQAIADAESIAREVLTIARQLAVQPSELRGIGIQVSRLESNSKASSGGIHNFLKKNMARRPPTRKSPAIDEATTSTGAGAGESLERLQDCPETESVLNMTIPPEIDEGTLSELPENIRREVLEEYRVKKRAEQKAASDGGPLAGPSRQSDHTALTSKQSNDDVMNLNFSQIESSFLEALPRDLQQELKTKLSRQKQDLPKCAKTQTTVEKTAEEPAGPYDDLTLPEMRALIKSWVRSEPAAQACDVEMLTSHFKQLARTGHLDTLDLLVKCLHRCVVAKNCLLWEEVFNGMVDQTQAVMLSVFGHRLLLCAQFPVVGSLHSSKTHTPHSCTT